MTTIQTEGSLLFVHKDSEEDLHLLIEMKGKLPKKLGQKCEDGFPAAEWKLGGTPGGSRSVHGQPVLRPPQHLVISTGRGTRLSRRGRCFLESGEWKKKGGDEGKTGKEGHNRNNPKGQEATVFINVCAFIYISVVKIQKCQCHRSQGKTEEVSQIGGD